MELRRRKNRLHDEKENDDPEPAEKEEIFHVVQDESDRDLRGSFWLTRIVFLRALAAIYAVAFAVALNQNRELIGDRGLLPLRAYLTNLSAAKSGFKDRFLAIPTLLWLWEPWEKVDGVLDGIATVGLVVSALVLITGGANVPVMASLWLLYHSLVGVGQQWYSFGWESQLLETGFLAIWMVPLWTWRALPERTPTPWVVIAGYRWLIMRVC
jgi:hypothetical protein